MKTCAVIPAFKVSEQILGLLNRIGPSVDRIYVIDDACPDGSGNVVKENSSDPRVEVLRNATNLGVGGAVKAGYARGLEDGMEIFVKIDGDGQMNPEIIRKFTGPIERGEADYTKGNRFFELESLEAMPLIRKVGNACLSLINKFTSGYWDVMDPTNGFTAIHRGALSMLPLDKIHDRYFFESDMLFRLGTIKAVVRDIPMKAIYGDEESGIRVGKTVLEFLPLYIRSFLKRIFYTYFLRDFNVASVELLAGGLLFGFGFVFGLSTWIGASRDAVLASTGTVMLAAVPLIMGFQLLLSALHFDIANVPSRPLQKILADDQHVD